MTIEVTDLTEADIPNAIEVIQQAFADDPYFKWVFDSTKFNKARNYESLYARCKWGINNAVFQVAKENGAILGVSCWLAPTSPTWYEWAQGWLLTLNQVYNNIRYMGRGGLRTNRYWIWKERQREAQREIWGEDQFYFCNIVAVSPGAQGRGVGRELFGAVTGIADREGVRCYLESSKNEPNVEIYRRMGFELVKEMECRDGEDACMLYCMVREPKESVGDS